MLDDKKNLADYQHTKIWNLILKILSIILFAIGVVLLIVAWCLKNASFSYASSLTLSASCVFNISVNIYFNRQINIYLGQKRSLTNEDEKIFKEIEDTMSKYDHNKSIQSMEEPWRDGYFDDLFILENRLGDQDMLFCNEELKIKERALQEAISAFTSFEAVNNEDLKNGTFCTKYYLAVEHPTRIAYQPSEEDLKKLEEDEKNLENLYRGFLSKYSELCVSYKKEKQKEVQDA